jgi:Phage tail assembly chaperone protein
MLYAEINGNNVITFPYDYDTLVNHNPYTNFPQKDIVTLYTGTNANLSGNQLVAVTEEPAPNYNQQTEYIVSNTQPTLVNGVWTLGWTINTLTSEQQAAATTAQAATVRQQRNAKLTACDWTQATDCPLTNKADWATYRQALRDLTKESGFPWEITWPTDPNGAK